MMSSDFLSENFMENDNNWYLNGKTNYAITSDTK